MFLTTDNKIRCKLLGWAAALTIILVLAGIVWFDRPLYLFMRGLDCPLWGWVDTIFAAEIWLAASLVILMIFYVKKSLKSKPKFRNDTNRISIIAFLRDFLQKTKSSYAFFVFCSVLSASLVAKVLKTFIGRARPIFFEALNMTGFYPPSLEWAFNSMPSGHATATFAGLVMLGLLAPKIKWATWTLAIIVGASRVAYGAHWPTDVLLGAFIGMVAADLVRAGLKWHPSRGDI